MTTWYVDYEGGSTNVASSGNSFATRVRDLTMISTKTILAGETVRIMGSPAVQSFGGSGIWTSSKLEATKTISTSTSGSPIVVTLTSHGYVAGDTIVITGHSSASANGTWTLATVTANTFTLPASFSATTGSGGTVRRRNNSIVTIASGVATNLASHGNVGSGRTAWSGVANVTTSLNLTDFKEGDSSDSIVIGASFTSGLAAYKATPSTIPASGCATTSFWIKQTSGTVAVSGDLSIRLCSDASGVNWMKQIQVPPLATLNRWTVVAGDSAGAVSGIQSVALYVDADKGAQTVLICNVIGSSSDQADLSCLIGKNTGTGMNAEPWCPIQSINGTRIMIDGDTNHTPISTTLRGYYGTTETVTTYFRKTIKTAITSSTTIVQSITDNGTAGSLITFSGGWDRTDMSTQTLETFFDGQNSQGNGIDLSSKQYVTMDKISCCRYYAGYNASGSFQTISNAQCVACSQAGFWLLSNFNQNTVSNCLAGFSSYGIWLYNFASSNKVSNVKGVGNINYGLILQTGYNNTVTSGNIFNNGVDGLSIYANSLSTFKNINSYANNSYGIVPGGGGSNNTFINCASSSGNDTGWAANGTHYLINCTSSGNISSDFRSLNGDVGADTGLYSMDHNGVSGNTNILMAYGGIVSTTSVRHTSSGIAWVLSPTNTTYRTSEYPVTLNVATVAVAANAVVTVKAWLRRSNTGLTLGLRILADQIAGVSSDVLSPMTAIADTWEEVTLTFTPTANGVVKIQVYCYGGSTYNGYVDDLTITQA